MPRFAICLHSLFSWECLYNDFHVFSKSTKNTCSSLSVAVGGTRPYLRSDPVWLSASRTRGRFPGETMFSVILLMSALDVLPRLQMRTSSQICIGESGSSLAQYAAMPCAVGVLMCFAGVVLLLVVGSGSSIIDNVFGVLSFFPFLFVDVLRRNKPCIIVLQIITLSGLRFFIFHKIIQVVFPSFIGSSCSPLSLCSTQRLFWSICLDFGWRSAGLVATSVSSVLKPYL